MIHQKVSFLIISIKVMVFYAKIYHYFYTRFEYTTKDQCHVYELLFHVMYTYVNKEQGGQKTQLLKKYTLNR